MKKILSFIIMIVMLMTSCSLSLADETPTISFDAESYTVGVGKGINLKAIITPKSNMKLEWSSSNEEIATVSAKGAVKGISGGETLITVKAVDNADIYSSCLVKVTTPVKKITFKEDKKEILVPAGSTYQLITEIIPYEADNKQLKWTSSNEKVASVDKYGLIRANRKGTVTIKATTVDGSNVSASIRIKVKKYDVVIKDYSSDYQTFAVEKLNKIELISGKKMAGTWEVKNHCVEMADKTNMANNNAKMKPLKTGEDTVTLVVSQADGTGKKQKIKFSVYVCSSAMNPIYIGGINTIMPFELVWGSNIGLIRGYDSFYRENFDYDSSDIIRTEKGYQLGNITPIRTIFGISIKEMTLFLSDLSVDGEKIDDPNQYRIIGSQYVLNDIDTYALKDMLKEVTNYFGESTEIIPDDKAQTTIYRWDLPNITLTINQAREKLSNTNYKISIQINFDWKGETV